MLPLVQGAGAEGAVSDVFVGQKQKRRAGVTAETLVIALLFALFLVCELLSVAGSLLARACQRRGNLRGSGSGQRPLTRF